MLTIDYDSNDQTATLTWTGANEDFRWGQIRRLAIDHEAVTRSIGDRCLSMPWWSFLTFRSPLSGLLRGHGITPTVSDLALSLLQQARENVAAYSSVAQGTVPIGEAALFAKLNQEGFTRGMTNEQRRNVRTLASLPAGASFSVPGAGKTTEALAYFFFRRAPGDDLLVVAPKNAFGSWDEQLALCAPGLGHSFVRLQDGVDRIREALTTRPRFMIISYQQLCRVRDVIASYLGRFHPFLFLDESHRIKRGRPGQMAEAVLSISHLTKGRLILSGTPMPQAVSDLEPQFSFLYPEVDLRNRDVTQLIRPIYVRTTKNELQLPPVRLSSVGIEMLPEQGRLYNLVRSEMARQAAAGLTTKDRNTLRRLGRAIISLIQLVSNPSLVIGNVTLDQRPLLEACLREGDGPKVRWACERARQLGLRGQKCIVWTSFVQNVELIASRLSGLGADYIHGGVGTGDDDDDETREGKIRRFRDDPSAMVLVANPAAAGESISLHRICRNAIYVDRTFNAAHFLQSMDRIHRLGLGPDESPNIIILECPNTIDRVIENRLSDKIGRMARVLQDPSLHIEPIPVDADSDEIDEAAGITIDDVAEIMAHLRGDAP